MIDRFNKHLNKIFGSYKKSTKIMEFRDEILGALMDRFNELTAEGLNEEESFTRSLDILDGIEDTIKSMEEDEIRESKPIGRYLLPSAAYWISVVLAYLLCSFGTKAWDMTWMIFIAGALIYLTAVSIICFKLSREKGLKFLSKGNLLITLMCISAAAHLLWSYFTHNYSYTWIAYVIGFFLWYVADIFLRIKGGKGKFKITAADAVIVTVLAAVIVYILISFIYGIWATSWLVFIVMALFIVIELMIFKKK